MILFYSRIIEYEREDGRKRVIFQLRIAEYRKEGAMAGSPPLASNSAASAVWFASWKIKYPRGNR